MVDVDEQVGRVCVAERAAVCDLAEQPAFRAVLIRTAEDRHRFVITNHHIVARWLVDADPAAGNLCQLLRAAAGCGGRRIAGL